MQEGLSRKDCDWGSVRGPVRDPQANSQNSGPPSYIPANPGRPLQVSVENVDSWVGSPLPSSPLNCP